MGAGASERGRGRLSRRALACLFWSLIAATAAGSAHAGACRPDLIEFRTSTDEVAAFSAEIAADEPTRAQGLMYREEMAADHGMLFVYPSARQVSFWMKNTPLPLDIVFLNKRGIVCAIAADTTPYSEETLPSRCAAQTVFEVNAGQAAATGVTVGAVARHPAILDPLWACE